MWTRGTSILFSGRSGIVLDFLQRRPNAMEKLLKDIRHTHQPVVLYGAGHCGKTYAEILCKNGIKVQCFCDDDKKKQGTNFCGFPVLPIENCPRGGNILISSYGPQKLYERLQAFDKEMLRRVLWSEFYLWEDGMDYYTYYMEHEEEIQAVCAMLKDKKSKNVLKNVLQYKISRDIKLISEINDFRAEDQYFATDIIQLANNEIFVDLGAYIGDTVQAFVKRMKQEGKSYQKIFAFEPDAATYRLLKNNVATDKNVQCINKGAYSENALLKFSSEGFWTSSFSADGTTEVSVCALDDELDKIPVTFLKADIEGAEMEALKGAKHLIATYKPKIACCIYHKKEDIFEIPLFLRQLNPAYQFYMRQYSDIPVETVLYAV